jgi:hypothetical protein
MCTARLVQTDQEQQVWSFPIRVHGDLPVRQRSEVEPSRGRGFDGMWLQAARLTHEQMVEVVRNSITDGQVCDWVRQKVKRTAAEKAAHGDAMLNRPSPHDPAAQQRLKQRKQELGLAHRDDIKTFVDLNDADEKRI